MRLLFRLVASLITLVVMLGAALLWRLGQGPIPLDFLTPRIEAAALELDPELQVRIGSTQLAWDQEVSQVDLVARDVHVSGGFAGQGVAVPSVSVRLELGALLRGEIDLAAVELVQPTLQLVRQADGRIDLGFAGSEAASPAPALDPTMLLAHVAVFGVRDGTVVVDDRVAKLTWRMSDFDLHVESAGEGAAVKASSAADLAPILGLPAAPRVPARLSAELAVEPKAALISITSAKIELDDLTVLAQGRILGLVGAATPVPTPGGKDQGGAAALTIEVEAQLASLPTNAVARYWPPAAANEARDWVTTNVTGGRVRDAVLRATATRAEGVTDLSFTKLEGTMAFEDLSVRFLDTMPPATGLAGTASVNLTGGAFAVSKGRLLDVQISQASVKLPVGKQPRIAIDAVVSGPLTSAFAVLDAKPVELASLLGFAPRAGALSGRVGFAFPLRGGLRFEDLGLTASAETKDAAVDRIAGDWNLTAGNFALSLQGPSLALDGSGRLQDVGLHASLRYKIGTADSLWLEARGDVDAAGWKRLGLDPAPWLAGTTAVKAVLTPSGKGAIQVDAAADLTRASIELRADHLRKPVGEAGHAAAKLRFDGKALTRIDGFQVSYGVNSASGSATRSPAGKWRTVHGKFTLAPRKVGNPPGQAMLEVADGGGFQLQSGDAGALFSAIGVGLSQKGRMTFTGSADLNQPGLPVDGRLSIHGMLVNESPLLARLLTLASLRGMLGVMTREGILFDRVAALLTLRDGVLTIREGVAHATTLGLRVTGTIDTRKDSLDLAGTVIPSYFGLNEALSKVPLLGQLLAGTEGKGVQSFDFAATGPLADPKVKVSALSSLTPNGFLELLRKIE